MESFISSCLQGRLVDVYSGDGAWFHSEVFSCVDGVLSLKSGIAYINVAVEKIIGIWGTCKEEYEK
ncbi:MAG: MM0924 family protein [Candidatus Wukongarchaeota archaeon]|nr:MM0924 family protein [Candidatus Wukongarchaeota archaeon]MDO8129589.1 MM0924 family protein [Candidatus Wukongarchaeota archaeon]